MVGMFEWRHKCAVWRKAIVNEFLAASVIEVGTRFHWCRLIDREMANFQIGTSNFVICYPTTAKCGTGSSFYKRRKWHIHIEPLWQHRPQYRESLQHFNPTKSWMKGKQSSLPMFFFSVPFFGPNQQFFPLYMSFVSVAIIIHASFVFSSLWEIDMSFVFVVNAPSTRQRP